MRIHLKPQTLYCKVLGIIGKVSPGDLFLLKRIAGIAFILILNSATTSLNPEYRPY